MDPQGAVVSRAHVTVVQQDTGITLNTVADSSGQWVVSGLRSSKVRVTADAPGFQRSEQNFTYNANKPARISSSLRVGSASEILEVTGEAAPVIQTQPTAQADTIQMNEPDRSNGPSRRSEPKQQQIPASANVFNLQKRVAGVLPVRVDVPRAGSSYRFVRPLVLDEETRVTFSYKTR